VAVRRQVVNYNLGRIKGALHEDIWICMIIHTFVLSFWLLTFVCGFGFLVFVIVFVLFTSVTLKLRLHLTHYILPM